jgi:hypothetical protein
MPPVSYKAHCVAYAIDTRKLMSSFIKMIADEDVLSKMTHSTLWVLDLRELWSTLAAWALTTRSWSRPSLP